MNEPADDQRRFLGALLLALGILIVTLCGGCTLLFGVISLVDILHGRTDREFGPMFALQAAGLFGLPPTLLGGGLAWWGIKLRRRAGRR